jgi:anthraniloyl-CoA monooxygenase
MEDAIALVARSEGAPDVPAALAAYQDERETEALRLQSAARNRMRWFESVARYTRLEPWQFTYSLLTGSQRIGHANLKLRDPGFVERVETELAKRVGLAKPRPPMFLPFELRGLRLENRIVVSPMAQYSAVDGMPNDWHLVHLGARATGGAGLLFTEMTCTSPDARISPGCTGIWNETQRDGWQRIAAFAHANSPVKLCMQLGHSGRKGSTQLGWEDDDHPLPSGNWETVAPSPLPYFEGISTPPREMTRADMDRVLADFVRSARFAAEAGFDMLELHMAHGYLLASFLSPLTNQRTDAYGGAVADRLRFPLEVLAAVRAAWPADKPLSVRLSSSDWAPGGLTEDELIAVARAMKAEGADLLDLSSGQTVPWQKPVYGRMWQTPFSDLVRNVVGIPTIAVGNIYEADHANSIIASGRADLCALARPLLADPAWTLRAAAEQRYAGQWWPPQYESARRQLERNLERAAQAGPV